MPDRDSSSQAQDCSSSPELVAKQARDAPDGNLDRKLSFEDVLASTELPPPGPSYYLARRALWLTACVVQPRQAEPSTSRQRLENLLSRPGAVNDEGVWKGGVEKVWKGLTAGVRLKRRLPLALVMKVIHAAWLRDPDTWPPGAVAPEPDDVLEESSPQPIPIFTSSMPSEYPSSITSPLSSVNGAIDQIAAEEEYPCGLVVAAER